MTIDELIAMLEMQEEILQFSHFTNEDAWELGSILTSEARRRQLPVAVTIRLNNGYTVFRYAADGTNCHDDDWTDRKFRSAKEFRTRLRPRGWLCLDRARRRLGWKAARCFPRN